MPDPIPTPITITRDRDGILAAIVKDRPLSSRTVRGWELVHLLEAVTREAMEQRRTPDGN